MKLEELCTLLHAELTLDGKCLDSEILTAFACDMMSDALAYVDSHTVLLTGLCTLQVLRTAEMLDIPVVVFVRGKQPSEEMLSLARENGTCILCTETTMFQACGVLYEAGLRGGTRHG